MEVYDIQYIKMANANRGFHFFSDSAMQWFKSRISQTVYQGNGGVYFVTSEKLGLQGRKFTVRQFEPETGGIKTISEYWQVSFGRAHRAAKRLAGK